MRSPSKRRTTTIRRSPGELEREAREERNRRRLERLQQVRIQSSLIANNLLTRVKNDREIQIRKLTEKELEETRRKKAEELAALTTEYEGCLADIGAGREAATEDEKYQRWLEKCKVQMEQLAQVRGSHAANKLKRERELNEKLRENKLSLRKSAVLVEKLRAAKKKKAEKIEVTEFRPREKVVQLVDKSKLIIKNDDDKERKGAVRKLLVSVPDGYINAVKEAEIEAEIKSCHHTKDRNEEKGRKAVEDARIAKAKAEYLQLLEEKEPCKARTIVFEDEVELIPTRGPSSSSETSASILSTTPLETIISRTPPPPPVKIVEPIYENNVASPSEISTEKVQESAGPRRKDEMDFIAKCCRSKPLSRDLTVRINVEEVSTSDITPESVRSRLDYSTESCRDSKLRGYIAKLLDMKREEMEALTSLSSIPSPSSTSSSRTDSVNNKTVRFSPHDETDGKENEKPEKGEESFVSKKTTSDLSEGLLSPSWSSLKSPDSSTATTISSITSATMTTAKILRNITTSSSGSSKRIRELKEILLNTEMPVLPRADLTLSKLSSFTDDGSEHEITHISLSD